MEGKPTLKNKNCPKNEIKNLAGTVAGSPRTLSLIASCHRWSPSCKWNFAIQLPHEPAKVDVAEIMFSGFFLD